MIQIAAIQMSDVKDFDLSWVKEFSIGSLVEGEIQEIKELGVVLGFKNHHDVVGFVAHHQCKFCILCKSIALRIPSC